MPLAILVSGILLCWGTAGASHVPVVWPPAAVLAGWLIRTTWRRPLVLGAGAVLTLVGHLIGGVAVGHALGWTVASAVAAGLLASRLTRHA
jgi:biotin transporter BioY